MNSSPRAMAVHLFASVLCLAISGCTLLSPRVPQTTLRPTLSESGLHWPAGLRLGRVTSVASLQDTRILVADGALRMQHPELRWLDPPPVMLEEELRLLQAQSVSGSGSIAARVSIDLWLASQELRVSPSGRLQVAVTATARLRCERTGDATDLFAAHGESSVDDAPRAVAAGFSQALSDVLTKLLSEVSELDARCGIDPTSPTH